MAKNLQLRIISRQQHLQGFTFKSCEVFIIHGTGSSSKIFWMTVSLVFSSASAS